MTTIEIFNIDAENVGTREAGHIPGRLHNPPRNPSGRSAFQGVAPVRVAALGWAEALCTAAAAVAALAPGRYFAVAVKDGANPPVQATWAFTVGPPPPPVPPVEIRAGV